MLTTVTPDGALRSRPMATQQVRDDGELWFILSDSSAKARDLQEEHAVNVAYADVGRHRYVSVCGNAEIVHDKEKLRELWKPEMERFFPKGMHDPHLALMRVRIQTAEYWDAPAGQMVALAQGARGGHTDQQSAHTRVEIRAAPSSG